MFGKSVALVLGAVGGILVVLGGLVWFAMHVAQSLSASSAGVLLGPVLALVVTSVVGLFVLLTSRPRIFWWPGRRLFNAVLLIVLGIVAWFASGGFVVTVVGAVLTIVAGVVLPLEGLVLRAFGWRRLFRRRIF